MEQIIITKPNLSTYPMASKRTATQIKSAKQTMALLGDDVVDVNVESPFPQTYGIGDKITVFGRVYKLNQLPKVKKTGMREFSYDIQFEGVQYDLLCATYDLTIDTTTNELQDVQADSLTGDLHRFATVLITNANRVFPGKWVLGTCPDTKTITLTFSETDNCLSVLQNLCSESNFNIEFEIAQNAGINTVNFKKVGQIFPYTFQFGRGKGLYSLDRQNVSSSSIVTRLKVQGSSDNITSKYRAQRLCLPGKTKAQSYIEKADAVAKYGIIEGKKFFDDIKPTFNGSVTGVFSDSVLKFVDTKMFDLNTLEADGVTTKYLIDGTNAKVHFNTGNLAGYEFEVHAYDHATHTFTLVKQTDDRGDVFPSDSSIAFQFAAGDEYKLIDVALPDTYEQSAESELANEGETYYDQNCQPKVQYGLSITKSFLEKMVGNGSTVNIFQPGDYIPVKDTDIDVDKSVRVQSLTRNLLDEYDYSLTISDTVSSNITNRVISELVDIDKIVQMNNLKNPARARANWRSSREVLNMVFDPDGDYYTDKIKPNSIDTLALSIGAKSMQFALTNTVFQPNYGGDSSIIKVTGGVLTHYTISENEAVSWVLADNETTLDSDSSAYYIYAKVQRSRTAGSIIFSTEQIKVEQDANYYHFLIGVLNSVDSDTDTRSISLTYGFTTINGRFIKTGRIESADGKTYFDLDDSEIGGRIFFKDGIISGDISLSDDNTEMTTAGLCGRLSVLPAFWAGGTLEDAINNVAKIILRKDGSGLVASGSFSWDTVGNVSINNVNDLFKLSLSPDKLDSLSDLMNELTYSDITFNETSPSVFIRDFSDSSQVGFVATRDIYSNYFTLVKDGFVNLNLLCTVSYENVTTFGMDKECYVKITNNDGLVVYNATGSDFVSVNKKIFLNAGTYNLNLYAHISIPAQTIESGKLIVRCFFNNDGCFAKFAENVAKTFMTPNGIAIISDVDNYIYMSLSDEYLMNMKGNVQITSKNGTFGIRVTNNGVQLLKYGTWSNL